MFDLTSGSFSNNRITHFSRARFARSNQEKFRHRQEMNRALTKVLEEGSNLVDILHLHIDPLLLHPLERHSVSLG